MQEDEPSVKCPSDLEGWATPLASSVTVPDATEVPVQVLEVVKNVNVTVPVGVPKAPARVALSCTVVPAGTATTTLCRTCTRPNSTHLVSSYTAFCSQRKPVA